MMIGAEAFIRAEPARIAARLAGEDWLRRWGPGLRLTPYEERGAEGARMVVSGVLVGTCEWWIEPHSGGALIHFWIRAKPTRDGTGMVERRIAPGWRGVLWRRHARLLTGHYLQRWRSAIFVLKDDLERRPECHRDGA